MAQGVEEGGSMRRWRMPGGGAAPGLLQRTEAGQTKGLDAFEGRMVGTGVMEADARDALVGRGGSGWGPWCRARRRGRSGR